MLIVGRELGQQSGMAIPLYAEHALHAVVGKVAGGAENHFTTY